MTPAERAAALRAIVATLASGDWDDANLVLGQFGFDTTWEDSFTGGLKTYLIGVLEDADPGVLNDLRDFLAGHDQAALVGADCWHQPGRLRLFGSYLHAHRGDVGAVADALALSGVELFAAHESIDVSREWQQVIEDALRSCDAAVVFLHDGFRVSEWTDQEAGFCLARRVPLLPLKYGDDPHGFLGRYQAADCASLTATQTAEVIVGWLCAESRTQAAMADAVVNALAASGSFGQTRLLVGCLERLPAFTADQLRRMEDAAAANRQVTDAEYRGSPVTALIGRIVAEHSAPPPIILPGG